MLLSASACHGQNSSSSSGVTSPSSGTTSAGSSAVSGGSASSGQAKASSVAPSFHDVTRKPSAKAEAAKNTNTYQVKTANYTYKKDNNEYTVSYPQIAGLSAAQQAKVNAAIKSCAMQKVTSLGMSAKKAKTRVNTSGDVTYEGKNFISVGFNEYVKLSPKAAVTHTLRTVNINLSTGAAVKFSDLIKDNAAFYSALEKEAKAQFSAQYASQASSSALQKNIDKNSVFFTENGVGFAVNAQNNKLLRVTLGYDEVKPFVTQNAAWKNFI